MAQPLLNTHICNYYIAGASAGLTSGQVATLDVLVKELLGRSDRPFGIGDIMQRCSEKKLALSEAAVTQARAHSPPFWTMCPHVGLAVHCRTAHVWAMAIRHVHGSLVARQ